jgi:hypothetical protein
MQAANFGTPVMNITMKYFDDFEKAKEWLVKGKG